MADPQTRDCQIVEPQNALVQARLPQTVRDAMQLCLDLGERYLWVNSLCITQDDPITQKQQIDIMDSIYASATLTIVAAAGDHADSGLPGISKWSREIKRADYHYLRHRDQKYHATPWRHS